MKNNLREEAMSRVMIAAHRGVSGGNIPCNTIDAFDAALYQGADIIELDVACSNDGKLFVFHRNMEPAHLCSNALLRDMTETEISELRYCNQDNVPTKNGVNTLDEVLEHLQGRCYINIDKFWEHIEPICDAVRRHNMINQVLVKTNANEKIFQQLEQSAPDIPCMVYVRDIDNVSLLLLQRKFNFVGVEVIFTSDDAAVVSESYIRQMHENKLFLWVNSIVFDHRVIIAAGHNDDISVVGHPDEGWGWLLDRGFNIIQTDWLLALKCYMNSR